MKVLNPSRVAVRLHGQQYRSPTGHAETGATGAKGSSVKPARSIYDTTLVYIWLTRGGIVPNAYRRA